MSKPEVITKETATQPMTVAQFIKNELQRVKYPKEGEVIDAELMENEKGAAYFDLGRFGTGVIFGAELSNAREMLKKATSGDVFPAKIVNLENSDGYIELSLAEAGKQQLWQKAKDIQESGEVVKVKINGSNSGGLLTDLFDLKAFLPVSQLSTDNYPKVEDGDRQKIAEELKKFIGQELSVKIIDVNPRSNKLILSERETLSENIKELISKYKVGQDIQVLVTSVASFGVFVRFIDDTQVEGLIHISELNHQIAVNPKDIVSINDSITAKIIDIKEDRIFLSLKALLEDPWSEIEKKYKEGQGVKGTVYQFNPYGAVINLDKQIQGLIHISEFGGTEEMKKDLIQGQEYDFIIDSMKPDEKRITLKIKK